MIGLPVYLASSSRNRPTSNLVHQLLGFQDGHQQSRLGTILILGEAEQPLDRHKQLGPLAVALTLALDLSMQEFLVPTHITQQSRI